jgi:hypothetical protein
LDSITKSPVFAQFSGTPEGDREEREGRNKIIEISINCYLETLTGLSTIRSTKSGPRFVAENNQKIDANTRMMHNIQAVNRW